MLLRLDYATFNFADMTHIKLTQLLNGGADLGFQILSKRAMLDGKDIADCMVSSPCGIFCNPNSGDPMHKFQAQFQGVGCKNFACVLPILAHDAGDYHISRLDFAQDYIMSAAAWRDLCTKAFSIGFSGQVLKKVRVDGSGYAATIYVGSRSSAYFFRIYNKTLEDPDYVYLDDNGDPVEIPENHFVIRYEIELHRFKRTQRGQSVCIDPTPLFDLYYTDEFDKFAQLKTQINELWQSYAKDLLPDNWMQNLIPAWVLEQNGKFCSNTDDPEYKGIVTAFAVTDVPHTFDTVMRYVVDKFGQYLPYILLHDDLYEKCKARCKSKFGFVPEFFICDVRSEAGYDDFEDPDEDNPF